MLTVALMLQVAGPVLTKPLTQKCVPRDEDEVVVCARPGASPYRLKPLPPKPGDPPADPLAFNLPGGGKGRVHALQSQNPSATGYGAGVTLRIPLGQKKKDADAKR